MKSWKGRRRGRHEILDAVRIPPRPTRHGGEGHAGLVSVQVWDLKRARVNTPMHQGFELIA